MKKKLTTLVTTALVVGAMSTTFAAANPFSDVPADHWAYDAVTQLAQDGIVNGYAADGTFKGDQNMTRYEMAQLVAKAMAKQNLGNVSNNDKAIIDKLAAEFKDELGNLGVRVSELESKVDNVQWGGTIKYEYATDHLNDTRATGQKVMITLEPSMTINDQWTAHTAMEYSMDANTAHNAMAGPDVPYNSSYNQVTDAYVEGALSDNLTVNLGRMPVVTTFDGGMVIDDHVTGAQAVWNNGNFSAVATAGRFSFDAGSNDGNGGLSMNNPVYAGTTATYGSLELGVANDKYSLGAGYHMFRMDELGEAVGISDYNADSLGIWEIGGSYNLGSKVALNAAYAKNTKGQGPSKLKKAYSVELAYGGADPEEQGSFGFGVAYRYMTKSAAPAPTYDSMLGTGSGNQKGWEINASYTLFPNVVASALYFRGKEMIDGGDDQNAHKVFGQLEFSF